MGITFNQLIAKVLLNKAHYRFSNTYLTLFLSGCVFEVVASHCSACASICERLLVNSLGNKLYKFSNSVPALIKLIIC